MAQRGQKYSDQKNSIDTEDGRGKKPQLFYTSLYSESKYMNYKELQYILGAKA